MALLQQAKLCAGFATAQILLGACTEGPIDEPVTETATQNWAVYLGDPGRQHHSPLTEINKQNVHRLEVAWSYASEPDGSSGSMYTSPIIVDGVLYGLSPSLVPFALDAATGEELWRNDLD